MAKRSDSGWAGPANSRSSKRDTYALSQPRNVDYLDLGILTCTVLSQSALLHRQLSFRKTSKLYNTIGDVMRC